MSMEYLVHDFAAYCRKFTPRSRKDRIGGYGGCLVSFHGNNARPTVYLTDIDPKFGFHFDHVYAHEITPISLADMVEKPPPDWMAAAYHWIIVGVSPDLNSKQNPWRRMLLQEYHENDFGECIHRITPSCTDLLPLHTLCHPN